METTSMGVMRLQISVKDTTSLNKIVTESKYCVQQKPTDVRRICHLFNDFPNLTAAAFTLN